MYQPFICHFILTYLLVYSMCIKDYLRKKEGDQGTANDYGVQNVPEVAAVAARV